MATQTHTVQADQQAVITYVQIAQQRKKAPPEIVWAAHEAAQRLSMEDLTKAQQAGRGGI